MEETVATWTSTATTREEALRDIAALREILLARQRARRAAEANGTRTTNKRYGSRF